MALLVVSCSRPPGPDPVLQDDVLVSPRPHPKCPLESRALSPGAKSMLRAKPEGSPIFRFRFFFFELAMNF